MARRGILPKSFKDPLWSPRSWLFHCCVCWIPEAHALCKATRDSCHVVDFLASHPRWPFSQRRFGGRGVIFVSAVCLGPWTLVASPLARTEGSRTLLRSVPHASTLWVLIIFFLLIVNLFYFKILLFKILSLFFRFVCVTFDGHRNKSLVFCVFLVNFYSFLISLGWDVSSLMFITVFFVKTLIL